MTSCDIKSEKEKKGVRLSFESVALGLLSFVTLFFIIKFPDVAIEYMQRGLGLTVSVVIPSLFPFMVVSELIVLSGVTSYFAKYLSKLSYRLFGVSGEGAVAFILGVFCGFPIGTRAAVSLYKRGKISFDELQRLVCFSNNPSSAFVISAVGVTLFGCRKFGIVLYFITILTSIMIGVGQNILCRPNKHSQCLMSVANEESEETGRGIAVFSGAVNGAALSMLSVSAFVVFFSTFTGTLGEAISYMGIDDSFCALLFSLFELTSGAASAACVRPLALALLITAFAVGWSGLSVHFQVISICEGVGLSLGRYFLSKLLQGILNVIFVWIYFYFFGRFLDFEVQSVGVFLNLSRQPTTLALVVSVMFLFSLMGCFFRKNKRRTKLF